MRAIYHKLKDPISALSHVLGFLAALVALVALRDATEGDARQGVVTFYGVTLAALFLASSLYHALDLGERGNRWLRRLDHVAIFFLIFGTSLPIVTHTLRGVWLEATLWAGAGVTVSGSLLKLFWIECPNWLGVGIYLAMGWMLLVPAHLIFPQLTWEMITWLLVGGAAYSIGALVLVFEWPDPIPEHFGYHEVWHMFVLAGAGTHFMVILSLLDERAAFTLG